MRPSWVYIPVDCNNKTISLEICTPIDKINLFWSSETRSPIFLSATSRQYYNVTDLQQIILFSLDLPKCQKLLLIVHIPVICVTECNIYWATIYVYAPIHYPVRFHLPVVCVAAWLYYWATVHLQIILSHLDPQGCIYPSLSAIDNMSISRSIQLEHNYTHCCVKNTPICWVSLFSICK